MKRVLMALAVVGFMAGSLFASIDVNTVPGTQESGFTTLVYTVSGSMKGWEFSDANANFATSDSVKLKGYVIFDVNDGTLVTNEAIVDVNDANSLNNTTIILLGSTASVKKAFAIVRDSTGDGDANLVNMNLATADASFPQPIFTTLKKGTPTKTQMVDAFFGVETTLLSFGVNGSMFGKLSSVSLDKDEKINLPKSFSACGELETFNGGFEDDDLTGTVKLSLNTSYTKNVDDFTVFKATAFVAADLIKKGYTQVTITQLVTGQ